MSIKCSYMDEQVYGAADLNSTVEKLVGSGLADPFTDGVAHNITKLNNIVYANGSEGIVPATNTNLQVSRKSGNTFSVATGSAFFANGMCVEVEDEPLEVTARPLIDNYIALKVDVNANTVECVAQEAEPEDDVSSDVYFVPLARLSWITPTGTFSELTDLRRYAKGKVASMYASDAGLLFQKTINLGGGGEKNFLYTGKFRFVACLDSGNRLLGLYDDREKCIYAGTQLPQTNVDIASNAGIMFRTQVSSGRDCKLRTRTTSSGTRFLASCPGSTVSVENFTFLIFDVGGEITE